MPTFDIGSKVMELKQTRQLGTQITTKGATLYDLLGKEVELRERRSNVLARQLEITDVEQALKASLKSLSEDIKASICLAFSPTVKCGNNEEIKERKSFFPSKGHLFCL